MKPTLQQGLVSVLLILGLLGKSAAATVTSAQIAYAEMEQALTLTHYKPIGICVWLKPDPRPHIVTTIEIEEYKPDLVVTVFNKVGDDAWIEANTVVDNVANQVGSSFYQAITQDPIEQGNTASQGLLHYADNRTKVVDVIGSPLPTLPLPLPQLDSDTIPLRPYYQSQLDILGRLGLAEATRPETYELFTHYIGTSQWNNWGYEFPRNMVVQVDNDYKAAVMLALRAADIVTNKHVLHTVNETKNTCGQECAVSNVIEETDNQHAYWQEVYPDNKVIQLGENDANKLKSLGLDDEVKGSGNYIFVVWRQYRGCVQHSGKFLFDSISISPTIKR